MNKKMNRWTYAVVGVIVLLLAGLVYAWSVFSSPIAAYFSDWTKAQLSLTFTICMAFFCVGGFVGGLLDCMGLTGVRRERVLDLLAQKNVPGIRAMAGQGELQRRDADDLVQLKEIQEVWMKTPGVNVYLTIDREQEGWDGHVGFVPSYLKEIGFSTDKTALLCGPPIMIKFVLAGLKEMGFSEEQVYTTLELRMKCGIGKCGRCNVGSKYVCKDGPVFRFDQLDELPNEY